MERPPDSGALPRRTIDLWERVADLGIIAADMYYRLNTETTRVGR